MNTKKQARLIKQNGEPASDATAEAINTVSKLDSELGDQLKLSILGSITSTESLELKGDEKRKASYTEALIARTRQAFKAEDYDGVIAALETKQKEWGNRGGSLINEHKDEVTAWALGLANLTNSDGTERVMRGKNSDGLVVDMPLRSHLTSSILFCLYALTSLSRVQFRGQAGSVSAKGKIKKAKPGLFSDENTKGVQAQTVFGFAGEDWKFRLNASYLVTDVGGASGSRIQKFFELIDSAAHKLNTGKPHEAGTILRTLTAQNPEDKRFDFDPSLIVALVLARFFGLLYSGAGQWLRELKDAKKNRKTIAAFEATEEGRLSLMLGDLARREAYAENHKDEVKAETIAESKVESPESKATLPPATQKPITWRDRAERRASKQVWARYSDRPDEERAAIIQRCIEENIAHADEGADFNVEATFEEYFSAQAINEWLDAEEADAKDAEAQLAEIAELNQTAGEIAEAQAAIA